MCMFDILNDFIEDEAGTTIMEYGLISAIVVAAAFSAVSAFGEEFSDFLGQFGCLLNDQTVCVSLDS